MTNPHETFKHVVDGAAIMTAVGTLMNMLPAIAALLSIIWTMLRLVEMLTGRTINELLNSSTSECECPRDAE